MKLGVFTLLLVCAVACSKVETPWPSPILQPPWGFPQIPFPEDNAFTQEKWELGKRLFYDPILSEDFSISCGSCHHAELGFSDDKAVSLGVGGIEGRRNSPSIANVAYHPYFTSEGGIPTLEMQILIPIQEHDEFNFNIVKVAERMSEDPSYVEAAQEIFGREPDAYVITRAIATFERTLVSGNSAYDLYLQSGFGLSEDAIRGKDLFEADRTNCSGCHSGFNFTNYTFENNGLYESYEDVGRFRLTIDTNDIARFKVPSLRNVELTGPYMHDGSISTLREVLDHYNQGGESHPHKSGLIKPLNLSNQEIEDLESFLRSLTDKKFTNNPLFYENDNQTD